MIRFPSHRIVEYNETSATQKIEVNADICRIRGNSGRFKQKFGYF